MKKSIKAIVVGIACVAAMCCLTACSGNSDNSSKSFDSDSKTISVAR